MVYIIKKDGTKEEFDAQKIVRAVNKSAQRILYTFSQQEIDFICKFATEHVYSLGKTEIPISDMHNIVEGALEKVNPAVAKSYRDYRNGLYYQKGRHQRRIRRAEDRPCRK